MPQELTAFNYDFASQKLRILNLPSKTLQSSPKGIPLSLLPVFDRPAAWSRLLISFLRDVKLRRGGSAFPSRCAESRRACAGFAKLRYLPSPPRPAAGADGHPRCLRRGYLQALALRGFCQLSFQKLNEAFTIMK